MLEVSWFSIILVVHIVCGSGALLSLWLPFIVRDKGGRLHRRAGWVFTSSMGGIGISSWLLAAMRLSSPDPSLTTAQNDANAYFLAYIGLMSSTAVWMGIRSVRMKQRAIDKGRWMDITLPALLLLASLILIAMQGVAHQEILAIIFGLLGMGTAIPQLAYWLRTRPNDRDWLVQHLSSMGNGAIAAVTAFGVVNIESMGLTEYPLLVWLGPGVLGGTCISFMARRFGVSPRKRRSIASPTLG